MENASFGLFYSNVRFHFSLYSNKKKVIIRKWRHFEMQDAGYPVPLLLICRTEVR